MPKMIDAEVAAVSEQLRNQFLLYREGERLPSYRSLLESCRCSRQTLTLVLRRLAKERVVRSEPRRGMFACGGGGRVRRILFFRVDWNCEHANRISEELQYEFSLRRNYVYTEQRYAPDQLEREIGKFSQRHCDLLILWLEEVEPQILLSLFRLRIPMVFFDCGIMLHGAAILDMQEELMGMLAAKHLVENGHRRIALLLTEPKGLTCTKKNQRFLRLPASVRNYAPAGGLQHQTWRGFPQHVWRFSAGIFSGSPDRFYRLLCDERLLRSGGDGELQGAGETDS